LAPIWEQVARDFVNEPEILIAKVDADSEGSKATAQAQGIKSYPTIKFFPKGSTEPVDYSGGRTEAAFVEFLNEKTGTHRTVGGGLDDKAGTIEILDEIIAKHVSSKTILQAAEEVKTAAAGLQDKFAAYYVRVLAKLAENNDYVRKELARLQKILGNSDLQREKADELISKSNILRQFFGKEEKVKDEL
jgi:protein disulfide-isomerase A6